jgi:hypothetical protein
VKEIGRRKGLGVILTSWVQAPAAYRRMDKDQSNDKSPRIDNDAQSLASPPLICFPAFQAFPRLFKTPLHLQNGTAKAIAGKGPCHQATFLPRGGRDYL